MPTMQHGPFYKLIIGNLVIVVIIFTVAATVSYWSLNTEYLRETAAYQRQLTVVARQYVEQTWPLPDAETDRLCKEFAREPGAAGAGAEQGVPAGGLPVRLTVIAADGRVLGDSQADPAGMVNHKTPDRPEVIDALEGRAGQHTHRSGTLATEYRYLAMPITHGGQIVGAVRVAMPVVAITQAQHVIRDTLAWTAVMTIVTFALVGLLVNWVWYTSRHRAAVGSPPDELE